MNKVPKVAFIEDNPEARQLWANQLGNEVEIINIPTLEKAEGKIREILEADIIVLDACVPGNQINVLPPLKQIRDRGYKGTLIAASSEILYNAVLEKAGCDTWAHKRDVASAVKYEIERGRKKNNE